MKMKITHKPQLNYYIRLKTRLYNQVAYGPVFTQYDKDLPDRSRKYMEFLLFFPSSHAQGQHQ